MGKVILAMMLLGAALLVSCGGDEDTTDLYAEFFEEQRVKQVELQEYYETELAKIKEQSGAPYKELKETLDKEIQGLNAEISGLKGERERLLKEVVFSRSETDNLLGGKSQSEYEIENLTATNKQVEANYLMILDKYNALLAIYPPRKFASLEALEEWREDKGEIKDIATLRSEALADGYLLIARSSDCLAVAGDNIYRVLPSDPDYVGTGALTIATEFNSIAEAEQFVSLNENKLPRVLIANASGKIVFSNYLHNSRYDCDDYAEDWENIAAESGFKFTQVPVINGRIWGVKVTNLSAGLHVGNWTKINNTYYYLETSPSSSRWNLVKILDAD